MPHKKRNRVEYVSILKTEKCTYNQLFYKIKISRDVTEGKSGKWKSSYLGLSCLIIKFESSK